MKLLRFGQAKFEVYPAPVPQKDDEQTQKNYKSWMAPFLPLFQDTVSIGVHPYTISRRTPIIKLAQQGDLDLLNFLRLGKTAMLDALKKPAQTLSALTPKVRFDELMSMMKRPANLIAQLSAMQPKQVQAFANHSDGAHALHDTLVRGDYLKYISIDDFSTLLENRNEDALAHHTDFAFVMRHDFAPSKTYKKHQIETIGNTDILPPLPRNHVPAPEWRVHEFCQEPEEPKKAFMGRVLHDALKIFARPGVKPPVKIDLDTGLSTPPQHSLKVFEPHAHPTLAAG